MRRCFGLPLVLLPCALLAACSEDPACRVGADCPSGVCLASGECAAYPRHDANDVLPLPDTGVAESDAGPAVPDTGVPAEVDAGETADAGATLDAGPLADGGEALDAASPPDAGAADVGAPVKADGGEPDSGVPAAPDVGWGPDASAPDAGPQGCQPNNDGTITKAELPIVLGAQMKMRVGTNAPVSTAGAMVSGVRTWDLSGALPGDKDVVFEPKAVAGQWFESSYPTGQYAVRMNGVQDTLGILQADASNLWLLGMASPMASPGATEVTYHQPVPTLAYPLQLGAKWSGTGIIGGSYQGKDYSCVTVTGSCTPSPLCCVRHVYTSEVDAAGRLVTPYGAFDVLRVKTVLDIEYMLYGLWYPVPAAPSRVRSYAFVSECFGTIASITSQDDESSVEFTSASEVRRLAP